MHAHPTSCYADIRSVMSDAAKAELVDNTKNESPPEKLEAGGGNDEMSELLSQSLRAGGPR